MNLEPLLDEYHESLKGKRSFLEGVEGLDFEPEAFVVFSKESLNKFKENGYGPKDIDEWLDSCAQGQCAPLLSWDANSRIETVWCFENGADALMFKLQFCS
jgi:hypothetical protein